ncbi:MAG: hypothetical protein JWP69_2175 [Flaviaesturariibacter sp.]|nr:hypothetical protein [Flaviaesturariibacter sp.]
MKPASVKGSFSLPLVGSLHTKKAAETILGNVYSLYCISSYHFPSPTDFAMEGKLKAFGTHFLLIKDVGAFLERVKAGIRALRLDFEHGFVEYYDREQFEGTTTLFQKPMEYAYQKEFRFYVYTYATAPLVFRIGSLEDIADMFETKDMGELKLVGKG